MTGCHKHSELAGIWVMQLPDQEEGIDAHDLMLPHWTLTLNDDGTFTQHMENYVMVVIVMNSSGKYTRSGDILTLNGTSETYSDDGYRKGTHRDPLTMRLKYADDALIGSDDQSRDLVFRRKGYHAPPKPKSRPRASDPKAVQIVHEMQRRYAALNTYSDEGTLISSGAGFMAKNARFQTRFIRPRKFRFQKVSGKDCYVIRLSNPEGMDLKLWVDKSSYLIRRAFDKMPKATISYQPKRDIKIAESEFTFSPPE